MSGDPHSVGDILDRLDELADENDSVCVADVVGKMGTRTYGPFLLVPALIGVTPVGGIPGVPTFLAIIVALVAAQMALGRDHLWLPGWIEDRGVSADKLAKSIDKAKKPAEWVDSVFHGRMRALTGPTAARIAAGVVLLPCLAIPPLELLPFAVALPMAAIGAFGIALTVRDGLLMLIAFAASAAAAYLVIANVLLGGGGGG